MEEKPHTIKIYFCFLKREKAKVEQSRGILPGPLTGAGFSAAGGQGRWTWVRPGPWGQRWGWCFSVPGAGDTEGGESLGFPVSALAKLLLVGLQNAKSAFSLELSTQ